VKRFLKEKGHADAYPALKVTFIPGRTPELFIRDDAGAELERIDSVSLLGEMELPVQSTLAAMETAGIAVDTDKLDRLQHEFGDAIRDAAEAVQEIIDECDDPNAATIQAVAFTKEPALPKLPEGPQLIFVYGTLRHGDPSGKNEQMIRSAGGELVSVAKAHGTLHDLGWYPAVCEGPGLVTGEVWRIDPSLLRRLDAYEGEEYDRVRVSVVTPTDFLRCWMYVSVEPLTAPVIECGDWLHRKETAGA
jgi:gamma-glutamylcyclotransferase (GGCT)/AIG2-like uncharacterized protein YtfP